MVGFNVDGNGILTKNDFLLAGSVSGFVSRAVVQPLDVLKTRFQLQVEPINPTCTTSKYHGFIQAIRCINKEEGAVAFWKGHIPGQLQAVAFSAVQFLSFEVFAVWVLKIRDGSANTKQRDTTITSFLCGCLAGSTAAAVTQPLDVLRTRFIAQGEPKVYQSMVHAAFYIAAHEGMSGYFRGLLPSLLLIAPQTGLQFSIYQTFNQMVEQIRQRMESDQGRHATSDTLSSSPPHNVGAIQSLVGGGLAGIGAKCIVYPLDMAKKRMQVRGFEEARRSFGRVSNFNNLRGCLVNIYREEGASALFKGLRPSLMKSCLSISCRFTAYDQVCRFIYYSRTRDATSKRTF